MPHSPIVFTVFLYLVLAEGSQERLAPRPRFFSKGGKKHSACSQFCGPVWGLHIWMWSLRGGLVKPNSWRVWETEQFGLQLLHLPWYVLGISKNTYAASH